MLDGSTSGRGFEHPLAPWLWGGLAIVALIWWIVEHRRIRRLERAEEEDGER